jgi:hypothetical protein
VRCCSIWRITKQGWLSPTKGKTAVLQSKSGEGLRCREMDTWLCGRFDEAASASERCELTRERRNGEGGDVRRFLQPRGWQQHGADMRKRRCRHAAWAWEERGGGPIGVDATWLGPESGPQRHRDRHSMTSELGGRRKEKGSNLNLKMTFKFI